MNQKKMALLAFMVLALVLLALPSTRWFIEETWKDMPAEAKIDLFGSAYVQMMAEIQIGGAHLNFSCDSCHCSPIADFDFHVECMDCHGDTGTISEHWKTPECRNCTICHWSGGSDIASYTDFISAGGFGMNTTPFDVGGMSGHEDLIIAAEELPQMAGANEACIACHTAINVSSINMSFAVPKRKYIRFDAGMGDVSNFDEVGMIVREANASK